MPKTPKSDKAKQSASPLSYSEGQHRIITADDGSVFELLHHINADELRDVLARHPGLLATNIVKAVDTDTHPDKPYKIKFGEGYFANARLAKKTNSDGSYEYFIERKVLPTETLKKKNSGREFSERKTVLKTSQNELRLSRRLLKLKFILAPKTSTLDKNTLGEDQLYQFLPISDLGDLSNIATIMLVTNLYNKSDEQSLYLTAVSNYMIRAVMELHAKNAYHRDIKPDNFLFDNNGAPLLADFGSLAYKTQEGTFETVSLITSARYKPFTFLYRACTSEEQKNSMHDQWALALSILEVHGIHIINTSIRRNAESIERNDPDFELKYKIFMRNFSALLSNNDKLKRMPDYLRRFVLSALNPDPKNVSQITETVALPDENNEEKLALSNIYELVCEHAVIQNEMFFESESLTSHKSTGTTNSDEYYSGYDTELDTDTTMPSTRAGMQSSGYIDYETSNKPAAHSPRLFQGLKPPSPIAEERSEELSGEISKSP